MRRENWDGSQIIVSTFFLAAAGMLLFLPMGSQSSPLKPNQTTGAMIAGDNANSDQEVVFTYGTTSSINLLAHSFGARLQPGDEILLSILEHHSNLVPWQRLAQRQGVVLRFLPMTPEGRLDLDRLDSELTERCRLVALTHCSNVTGALTDVGWVVAASRAVGAKVMLDGASARRMVRSTFATSTSTSTRFPVTRPMGRPASACCGAGASFST